MLGWNTNEIKRVLYCPRFKSALSKAPTSLTGRSDVRIRKNADVCRTVLIGLSVCLSVSPSICRHVDVRAYVRACVSVVVPSPIHPCLPVPIHILPVNMNTLPPKSAILVILIVATLTTTHDRK